jgi:hypothetical protein
MAATRSPTTTVTLVRWSAGPRPGDTLDIHALAAEAGLHPDVVRRFVDLGLLAPVPGPGREPRFPRDAAAILACAQRLRRDLGIGYAGAVLACELLSRIDDLQTQLRRYEPRGERPGR